MRQDVGDRGDWHSPRPRPDGFGFGFASLGSGSAGNAWLIEARCGNEVTRVLVDCGFGPVELIRRLEQLGRFNSSDVGVGFLDAIFVTHEHSDHAHGVFKLARRWQIPVYLTQGTLLGCEKWHHPSVNTQIIRSDQRLSVGLLEVFPVAVPHDAREPVQFILQHNSCRLGILTDLGCVTPHVMDQFQSCDGLALEFNHDDVMLLASSYPYSLKQRIRGGWGHLNNEMAASLLQSLMHQRLQWLVASHLSEQNNSPERVKEHLEQVLCGAAELSALTKVVIANQVAGTEWLTFD